MFRRTSHLQSSQRCFVVILNQNGSIIAIAKSGQSIRKVSLRQDNNVENFENLPFTNDKGTAFDDGVQKQFCFFSGLRRLIEITSGPLLPFVC